MLSQIDYVHFFCSSKRTEQMARIVNPRQRPRILSFASSAKPNEPKKRSPEMLFPGFPPHHDLENYELDKRFFVTLTDTGLCFFGFRKASVPSPRDCSLVPIAIGISLVTFFVSKQTKRSYNKGLIESFSLKQYNTY
jgi:hypothetical protein